MPDFRVGAAEDLPIDADRAWSQGEATDRIFAWAGWDGATPPTHDGGQARRGFLLYDASAPDLRASYILPFADVIDGALRAIPDGIGSAEAGLPNAEDVSPDAREQARKVIDNYQMRMDASGEAAADGTSSNSVGGQPLALIPVRLGRGLIPAGALAKDLPEGLAAQIQDPSVLQDTALYLFSPTASTDSEDYYGTIMRPSSLRNYSEDAKNGLPFMSSHDIDRLPLGRVYDGRFKANRGRPAETVMDTYLPADLNISGIDTTQVVRGIRTGVLRDVSITFDPEAIICSIDNRNIPTTLDELFQAFDEMDEGKEKPRWCLAHFPGADYVVDGRKVHCTGGVEGAHCIELSGVYRGATPGARIPNLGVGSRAVSADGLIAEVGLRSPSIRMAVWMAEAGRLDRAQAVMLEQRTRGLRFPSTTTQLYAARGIGPTTRAAAQPTTTPPTEATRAMTGQQTTESGGEPQTQPPETSAAAAAAAAPPESAAAAEAAPGDTAPQPGVTETTSTAPTGVAPTIPVVERSADALAGIRQALTTRGLVPAGWTGDVTERVVQVFSELTESRSLLSAANTELAELRPLATTGREARAQMVRDVEAAGVRAHGNSFNRAAFQLILDKGEYQDLLTLKAQFDTAAAERGIRPGRVTQDVPDGRTDATGSQATTRRDAVPPVRSRSAFRSR